jgi:hypothetical protein
MPPSFFSRISSFRISTLAVNGFGRGSLTVVEAWAMYHTRYPIPPDMHLPTSSGWRMAINGIVVPPPPGTEKWRDAIRAQRMCFRAEERADPTWAPTSNDE